MKLSFTVRNIQLRRKGEMLNRKIFFSILMAILTSTVLFNSRIAFSQEKPLLYVDPPIIKGIPPSENFTISLKIANITDFYGFGITFSWDPAILDYVSHTLTVPVEDHPEGVLHKPVIIVSNEVDETAGTYKVAASSMYPAPSFNGSGTIFEITFHVKTVGRCLLKIDEHDLSNSEATPIDHEVSHGYFTNFVPPSAKISVDPKRIIDSNLTPCKNFTVNINLENVIDLKSFEFWLGYNTTILDVMDVTANPIFPPPVEIEIDEPEGQIMVAASLSPSYSGSLSLASITFHVATIGESILDLHSIYLIDAWGEVIPYEELDGYFSNVLKAKLYVDPAEIINPTLTPGSKFTIDIKTENVVDLYGYEFKLTYDNEVLTCLGAVIFPPNNDTNFNTEISMVDEMGYIKINVTYYPPAEPITIFPATTIVTIHFQVESYGATILDLCQTRIIDQYGATITHDVEDGFFATLIPDIAVVSVTTSANAVYPGRIVNITVVAANVGDTTETFNVTAYYDDNPIATRTVFNLAPDQNVTLTFTWDTTGLEPCNNYTIKAEASPVVYETNLENNLYIDGFVKIKMIGDVNGDGKIDIYDVVLVISAYGCKEEDPDWIPDADVAPPYGIINIYDVVTVASKYGQQC